MDQKAEGQAQQGTAASATGSSQRESVALAFGKGGILGVKAGMTQVYNDQGDSIAVTVIDLKPVVITQVKTVDKEGYKAIQVGFLPKKAKSANKPEAGHAKKSGEAGFYHYQEFRLPDDAAMDSLTIGKVLSPEFVKEGDVVDLTAMSKGKGFQGGMKRFHMAGGFKSHGASLSHRQLGSIGNRADPAKCFKNKKMPGQMGREQVTMQNLRVVSIDRENNLMLVKGSVPGPKNGLVTVRKAIKSIG